MINKRQREFVIQNREMLMEIAGVYLDYYKTLIWKEKDLQKKAENSAVADRIDDLIATIKNLDLVEPSKKEGEFTGI
jgi:hypothetical protein